MKRITIGDIAKIGILSGFIGVILFLIIELFWVDLIKGAIETYQDDFWVVLILFGGFILSAVCSIIAGYFSSEMIKNRLFVLWSSLFALFVNILIWTLIAYYSLKDSLPEASAWERFVIIPKIISYYAIYSLSSPLNLWLFGQITYTILFSIFLYFFTRKHKKTRRR